MTDESERIIPLYERHAQAWDRLRGRSLFERGWLERFATRLPQPASILDIGCGSGEPIARHLIKQGYAVTGVDSSPAMIEFCKGRFPDQSWVVADMRELALASRFGGILAWDSFFHLSPKAQRGMFEVFARHAAPNAALMFTSGPRHGVAMGTFEGEPLYHGSLDEQEYRSLLGDNGFRVVSHAVEDPACGGHTIWLAQAGG